MLAVLADVPEGLPAAEVRRAAPTIDVKVSVRAGSQWASPRVLTQLGATADVARGTNLGHWLPGDLGDTPDPGPWVALLPVLDPTVMGWKERGFYLGPRRELLFDRAGNAGTTAWVDGRIVGCWVQDDDGVVAARLLEPVRPPRGRRSRRRRAGSRPGSAASTSTA